MLTHLNANKLTESLNELCYIKFNQKIAGKKTAVLPQTLPPTFAAAKYHGWRVHLQVIEWSGVTGFNPEKWGWALKENKLLPISTDRTPAPSYLFEIFHCNCKVLCGRNRCS